MISHKNYELCEKAVDLEEIRFKIVKGMLEEFPSLRRRVKEYLKKKEFIKCTNNQ